MATGAQNAITVLTNILATLNALEAGSVLTGEVSIDNETRRLITTRRDILHQTIMDSGSRAAQNSTQVARQSASGGAESSIDANYKILDDFMRDLQTQINTLNNPTSVARRQHTPLR